MVGKLTGREWFFQRMQLRDDSSYGCAREIHSRSESNFTLDFLILITHIFPVSLLCFSFSRLSYPNRRFRGISVSFVRFTNVKCSNEEKETVHAAASPKPDFFSLVYFPDVLGAGSIELVLSQEVLV
jgi:hypothetical protein